MAGRSSFRAFLVAATLIAALAPAPVADAATPLGQLAPPDDGDSCDDGDNVVQVSVESGPSYEVPSDGVITAWAQRGDDTLPGSGRLLVWRPAGGTTATIVGRSDLAVFSAAIVNVYATRIPVAAGDRLGIHLETTTDNCIFSGGPGDVRATAVGGPPDPSPGDTLNLARINFGSRLNVAAILEPDADCDGFGDESQDNSINPLDCDKEAPETTITSGPAPKTRSRDAMFTFTSSEPGSSFQCQLDGGTFVNCGSPFGLLKLKKGSHTFAVRAKDPAVNADQTPATLTWLVKKKKRKHHKH